jgi:hypothetical protein
VKWVRKDKMQGKLKDRGTTCFFVAYSPIHACNVYRMLKVNTNHVIKLRDITWLHKTYEIWFVKDGPTNEKDDDTEDDDSILVNSKAHKSVEQDEKKDTSSKVIRETKKL